MGLAGAPEAAAMAAGAAPEGRLRRGRRQGALRAPRALPALAGATRDRGTRDTRHVTVQRHVTRAGRAAERDRSGEAGGTGMGREREHREIGPDMMGWVG